MNNSETVSPVESDNRVRPLQFIVAGLCFFTVFIDSFATQTVAVAGPLLREELSGGSQALGLIFGMNMFGGLVGALAFGPLGDRWGRRPLIIAALIIISVGSLVSAFAHTSGELAAFRFVTGLGLGGALPNTVSLVTEYAPPRLRSRFTATVFNGFPLGAIVGSFVGAQFVVSYGWRSVFLLGAATSATILLLVATLLPESLQKLRQRGSWATYDRLQARLGGMGRLLAPEGQGDAQQNRNISLLRIFAPQLASVTILLSLATFLSMLCQYSILNWLPTLASEAGVSTRIAINSITALLIGAIIGNFLLARIGDRASPYPATALFYGIGGGVLALTGWYIARPTTLLGICFVGGLLALGAQLSLTTITARLFDVEIRSTAVGWALAMGRVGAAVGPMAAGWALARGMTVVQFMTVLGLLFLLAGLSVFCLGRLGYTRARPSASDGAARVSTGLDAVGASS